MQRLFASLLLLLFTSACAQQALILSEPPGALVLIDGREIGMTPCAYPYNLSAGEHYAVELRKPGFENVRYEVVADEWDARTRDQWFAAGLVWSPLWLGTLFSKRLKESYEFVLRREGPTYTAQATPAAPIP